MSCLRKIKAKFKIDKALCRGWHGFPIIQSVASDAIKKALFSRVNEFSKEISRHLKYNKNTKEYTAELLIYVLSESEFMEHFNIPEEIKELEEEKEKLKNQINALAMENYRLKKEIEAWKQDANNRNEMEPINNIFDGINYDF